MSRLLSGNQQQSRKFCLVLSTRPIAAFQLFPAQAAQAFQALKRTKHHLVAYTYEPRFSVSVFHNRTWFPGVWFPSAAFSAVQPVLCSLLRGLAPVASSKESDGGSGECDSVEETHCRKGFFRNKHHRPSAYSCTHGHFLVARVHVGFRSGASMRMCVNSIAIPRCEFTQDT